MLRLVVLLGLSALLACAVPVEEMPAEVRTLSGQALVDYINNKQSTWEATIYPRFEGLSDDELRQFLGAKEPTHEAEEENVQEPLEELFNAPPSFDSAENWPQCAGIIGLIQDQSACGSCWAVSTTSVLSDRLCIASESKIQKSVSALDLMACCSYCGYQCDGGWPEEALAYFAKVGVVTGSNYTSDDGCKSYPIPPCKLDPKTKKVSCPDEPKQKYKCVKSCNKGYTEEPYANDKYYGKGSVLRFSRANSAVITELNKRGPVVATFAVYRDFYNYKGGVYQHTAGELLGYHAVRIVGYGEEKGVKFWKVANSWNWFWGEQGYFRIRRDTNEASFEKSISAIEADVERSLKDK